MLVLNGAELGEDLLDDSLKLLESLNADLRDIVDHDVRVDPKFLLGLFSDRRGWEKAERDKEEKKKILSFAF